MNQDQDIKHREQKPDPFPADTLYELRELLHARNLDMERLKELLHASNKDLERLKEENAALIRQRKMWCMCEAETHTHLENLVRRLVPSAKLDGDDLVQPMIEELGDMLAGEIERLKEEPIGQVEASKEVPA